ncbi:unnamed protein product [Toxocara canis]|uniref:Uncharacterized protein n=1 Tax=Toxocara canis TaxID=6265 RepID=A0A183U0G6_TOXCA|nr:unnamed protein product [Toxocara canis]
MEPARTQSSESQREQPLRSNEHSSAIPTLHSIKLSQKSKSTSNLANAASSLSDLLISQKGTIPSTNRIGSTSLPVTGALTRSKSNKKMLEKEIPHMRVFRTENEKEMKSNENPSEEESSTQTTTTKKQKLRELCPSSQHVTDYLKSPSFETIKTEVELKKENAPKDAGQSRPKKLSSSTKDPRRSQNISSYTADNFQDVGKHYGVELQRKRESVRSSTLKRANKSANKDSHEHMKEKRPTRSASSRSDSLHTARTPERWRLHSNSEDALSMLIAPRSSEQRKSSKSKKKTAKLNDEKQSANNSFHEASPFKNITTHTNECDIPEKAKRQSLKASQS